MVSKQPRLWDCKKETILNVKTLLFSAQQEVMQSQSQGNAISQQPRVNELVQQRGSDTFDSEDDRESLKQR